MLGSGADNLVFLDESGINIDMTRHYARAKTDERAVDSTPLNTPRNTTILSSIRLDGRAAHTVYQGGTTAERFAKYLKTPFQQLPPPIVWAGFVHAVMCGNLVDCYSIRECP